MAGVNFPLYSTTDTTTIRRSVAEDVVIVNQVATPLLNAISPTLDNLPEPFSNLKFEWVERDTNLLASTLAAAITTTAATTFTVASGHGEFFLVGHILKIDSEHVVVTTAGTAADVVAVTRGYGSTTKATHLINAPVTIIGRISLEGNTTPTDTYTPASMPWNAIQLFERTVEFSKTRRLESRFGEQSDPMAEEEMAGLKEIMLYMERQTIHGKRVARTTVAGGALATAGAFGGTPVFTASGNKNALSSARLSKDDVDDLLAEIFALVTPEYMPDLMVLGSFNKRLVSSWYDPFRRTDRSERRGGGVITDIETEWGVLDILLDWNMPADEVQFLHTPFLAIGPYEGHGEKDDFAWQPVPITNVVRRFKRDLSGQYTFMMKNPNCHGAITGTATS